MAAITGVFQILWLYTFADCFSTGDRMAHCRVFINLLSFGADSHFAYKEKPS